MRGPTPERRALFIVSFPQPSIGSNESAGIQMFVRPEEHGCLGLGANRICKFMHAQAAVK
jgi:hypothetical protein